MKEIISRELLKSVIPSYDYMYVDELNIYELAHICKEWAFTKGYILDSAFVPKGRFTSSYCVLREGIMPIDKYIFVFHSETEPGVIFKACQWILDNKDNK